MPITPAHPFNAGVRQSMGPLFAEYLRVKLPPVVASGDARQWQSVAAFVENPELLPAFRAMAAKAAIDAVLMLAPAPEAIVARTVHMSFRLLSMPDANGLHSRVAAAWLPSLLGMEGLEARRAADAIFGSGGMTTAEAARILQALPKSEPVARLRSWLGE